MNILLGDISSYKAIVVAKFIKENYSDCKIYSFDSRKFTKSWRTKYVDRNFIVLNNDLESFQEIIESNSIDFFIPVINESLEFFWNNKSKFNGTLDYLGDFESYQILNDKIRLSELAVELGVTIPKRYATLKAAKVPFVYKPTNLSSSKGVVYVRDKSNVLDDIDETNLIIQQFVEGEGVGYSFYAKNGVILNGYGHKRLSEFPVSGGSSTYRTVYEDVRMIHSAERIVKALNYTGFAMFEYKLNDKNELYLLEVNPRIWGSINQGLVNGINYFEAILGKPKHAVSVNSKSYNTYISPLIYASFIGYILKFNLIPIVNFMRNVLRNKPDVSLWSDFNGFVSIVLRKILK